MMAALAGGCPPKNSHQRTRHEHAVDVDVHFRRRHRTAAGEFLPMEQSDQSDGNDKSDQRDRLPPPENVVHGICEKLPIMMFCGLPVIVAVDPTLEAIATASR